VADAAVIVVAQRVSTIIDADQILVLEDGHCVGLGTHDELLATCPTYAEIVASQLGRRRRHEREERQRADAKPPGGGHGSPRSSPAAARAGGAGWGSACRSRSRRTSGLRRRLASQLRPSGSRVVVVLVLAS
jgi:hypothetical protein